LITVTFNNVAYDEELRLPDTDEGVVSIVVEGHAIPGDLFREAGPDDTPAAAKGENIICAAVSFAGLNLVRSMTIIAGVSPEYKVENGLMRLSLATGGLDKVKKSIARVLIESFIIGMLDLERKYGRLVRVIIDKKL
jgi:uncharacterized protein YsxB (DUF464 family)